MSACENSMCLFMLPLVSEAPRLMHYFSSMPSRLTLFFVISNIYKVKTKRVGTAIAKLNQRVDGTAARKSFQIGVARVKQLTSGKIRWLAESNRS